MFHAKRVQFLFSDHFLLKFRQNSLRYKKGLWLKGGVTAGVVTDQRSWIDFHVAPKCCLTQGSSSTEVRYNYSLSGIIWQQAHLDKEHGDAVVDLGVNHSLNLVLLHACISMQQEPTEHSNIRLQGSARNRCSRHHLQHLLAQRPIISQACRYMHVIKHIICHTVLTTGVSTIGATCSRGTAALISLVNSSSTDM